MGANRGACFQWLNCHVGSVALPFIWVLNHHGCKRYRLGGQIKQLSHTGMAWRFTNSSSLCFSAGRGGSMRFLYHCLSIQRISEGFFSEGWPLNSSAQGFAEKSNPPKTSKDTLCSSSKVIAAEIAHLRLASPFPVTVVLWGGYAWHSIDDGPPGCEPGRSRNVS